MHNGKYELIIPPPEYPGRRYRGRYAYEHHVVFWRVTGRLRRDGCVIHHRNDQKRENGSDNLEEKVLGAHSRLHSTTGRTMSRQVCGWCHLPFQREARQFQRGQINFYCCRSHQVRAQRAAQKFYSTPAGAVTGT